MNKGKIIGLIAVLAVAGAALRADAFEGVQPLMVREPSIRRLVCIYRKEATSSKLK